MVKGYGHPSSDKWLLLSVIKHISECSDGAASVRRRHVQSVRQKPLMKKVRELWSGTAPVPGTDWRFQNLFPSELAGTSWVCGWRERHTCEDVLSSHVKPFTSNNHKLWRWLVWTQSTVFLCDHAAYRVLHQPVRGGTGSSWFCFKNRHPEGSNRTGLGAWLTRNTELAWSVLIHIVLR